MSRLLRKVDYQVTTADSKATALTAAGEDFDLLISNIDLPDGTGLKPAREFLARRPVRGIALTGYGSESDTEETRRAGFAAHLTKPIQLRDADDVIRQVDR